MLAFAYMVLRGWVLSLLLFAATQANGQRGRIELTGPIDCPREIILRGDHLPGVLSEYDFSLGSQRYYVEASLRPERPRIAMPLFHGIGALETSHAGNTVRWARVFTNAKDRVRKRIAKDLAKQGIAWPPVVSETIDWPMSGNFVGDVNEPGLVRDRWGTYDATRATLSHYFTRTRGLYDVPYVVPIGQSAGAGLIGDLGLQRQLDGMILIGAAIPGINGQFEKSIANYLRLEKAGAFRANWPAFQWVKGILSQGDWTDAADPFLKPTLILVGENDPEVPKELIAWFQELARTHPMVEFHIVPGAYHDVLSERVLRNAAGEKMGEYDPTFAYGLIADFLNRRFPEKS